MNTQFKNKKISAGDPTKGVLNLVPCNLCGQDEFTVKYNSPIRLSDQEELAYYLASTDRFDRYGQIVQCKNCGLVYTNPRLSTFSLKKGYAETKDQEYIQEDASRGINAFLSLSTIKKFVKEGKMLDIGCATGFFLNVGRTDFEVIGLELSPWAADFARTKFKLKIITEDLISADLENESFDIVTLIDVIEHLADPINTLKEINRILKPSGVVYLLTPNIDSISAKIMRGKWWGLRPAHLYYFSPYTITQMLKKNGFEILLIRSFGRIFTYGYWLSRLKNYNPLIYKTTKFVLEKLNITEKFVYINTRDSMEICARKVVNLSNET